MRLVYFDSETTGVDPHTARIIDLAMLVLEPTDDVGRRYSWRVNPGVPIPKDATEIHGITDADVASCPRFQSIAREVADIVAGAVLVGYNCRTYDTVLLDAELVRAGLPGLERDKAGRIVQPEIDLLQLWWRHEDRKLLTAARRFANVDLADAHNAEADMRVLPDILRGMCRAFALNDDIPALCQLSIPDGAIDRDGKFKKRDDGVIVFTFGKHAGEPVAKHPDFVDWMLTKDFSPETKAVARAILRHEQRRSA